VLANFLTFNHNPHRIFLRRSHRLMELTSIQILRRVH